VDNEDQTSVGERKYAVAPNDANNDPAWEVYDRNAQMPGADGISSTSVKYSKKSILAIFGQCQEVP
jgi:hypothetical protein